MMKRILVALIGVVVVVGFLGGAKFLQIRRMLDRGKQFVPPPETVTTAKVKLDSWDALLTAVGSVEAVQGVTVTAELSGKVVKIAFEPGSMVKAGDLLVQQDISSEEAQLRAAEATTALAKIELDRTTNLLASNTVSQSEYDNANAKCKEAVAQADAIRSAIAKKTIRAPFEGRLGLRRVNLGQILKEGEEIVTLQTLDPIYVNFQLPQQQLGQVQPGLTVRVTSDALRGETLEGKLTAISPEVDSLTRNVKMQATLSNPQGHLSPGMFVEATVVLPAKEKVLAVPATAVLYAPYGNSVYVVEDQKDEPGAVAGTSIDAATTGTEEAGAKEGGAPGKVVRQQFVRLGESRGDFVAVLSGLTEGETIVSTGVFKLRNGQSVVVDNSLSPKFHMNPQPTED